MIIKENYKRVIEIECLKKLITYKGRIEALRKRIGNGYNIPIFISDKICFIKVGKIYWVNYFKIKCVLKSWDVVLINGEEATVKKVVKTNEGIELHSMNPYYPIKKFTYEDMKNIPVKIIGRVKEAKIKGFFE